MQELRVMIGPEILKRTFEGKNDNPLTSSYHRSKKWLLRYRKPGYDYNINELFITKKEAEETMLLRSQYMDIMFQKTEEINNCATSEELFKEYDDLVYYADGDAKSVTQSIEDEGLEYDQFDFYLFDGWCIAMWK